MHLETCKPVDKRKPEQYATATKESPIFQARLIDQTKEYTANNCH